MQLKQNKTKQQTVKPRKRNNRDEHLRTTDGPGPRADTAMKMWGSDGNGRDHANTVSPK